MHRGAPSCRGSSHADSRNVDVALSRPSSPHVHAHRGVQADHYIRRDGARQDRRAGSLVVLFSCRAFRWRLNPPFITFNKNRTRRKLLSVPNKVFCCRFVRAVPTQRAFCCGACPPLRAWAHSHRSSTATRTPTLMTRASPCRSVVPGGVKHWMTWLRRRNRCCWAGVAQRNPAARQGRRGGRGALTSKHKTFPVHPYKRINRC